MRMPKVIIVVVNYKRNVRYGSACNIAMREAIKAGRKTVIK